MTWVPRRRPDTMAPKGKENKAAALKASKNRGSIVSLGTDIPDGWTAPPDSPALADNPDGFLAWAPDDIQVKVWAFRQAKSTLDTEAAKALRLRDAFSQSQMATLLNRMQRFDVASSPKHVQEAHAAATKPVKQHTGEKRAIAPTVAKIQALTLAVCGHKWTDFIMTYSESFTVERTKEKKETEFYEWELTQQIGKKQFEASLGVSIFPHTNEAGEPCFVRRQGSSKRTDTHSQTLSAAKSTELNEDEIEDALKQYYCGNRLHIIPQSETFLV